MILQFSLIASPFKSTSWFYKYISLYFLSKLVYICNWKVVYKKGIDFLTQTLYPCNMV